MSDTCKDLSEGREHCLNLGESIPGREICKTKGCEREARMADSKGSKQNSVAGV